MLMASVRLCVVFAVLVALCNLSAASLLSNSQTFNETWVELPAPNINSSSQLWSGDHGGPFGIDDEILLIFNVEFYYNPTYVWQSYLYKFNLQLELTASLNLTDFNPSSPIGSFYSFGNSINKQLYLFSFVQGDKHFNVIQVDSSSMSVVSAQSFNGTVYTGFVNYEGTEVVYGLYYKNQVGFLVLNASGLALINFYPFNPPSDSRWVEYPQCTASNNEPTVAYCWCELLKGVEDIEYIFTLSLTTFKMVNYVEASPISLTVAYPGYSSPADLFVVSYLEVHEAYSYNLTGYSSDLKQIWQSELTSNTSEVYGLISVGNSVAVSTLPALTEHGEVLLEFDSSTGQQMAQWNNTTPFIPYFENHATPAPFFESNGVWDLIGLAFKADAALLIDVQVTTSN